jgi:hypothetical protein
MSSSKVVCKYSTSLGGGGLTAMTWSPSSITQLSMLSLRASASVDLPMPKGPLRIMNMVTF